MTEPDTQTVLGQRATPEAKVCSLVWRKPLKQPQSSRPWHSITLRLGATSETPAEELHEYFRGFHVMPFLMASTEYGKVGSMLFNHLSYVCDRNFKIPYSAKMHFAYTLSRYQALVAQQYSSEVHISPVFLALSRKC